MCLVMVRQQEETSQAVLGRIGDGVEEMKRGEGCGCSVRGPVTDGDREDGASPIE